MAELKLKPHSDPLGNRPGQQVIEVWHDGALIGQVTAGDGPAVRVISKYPLVYSVVSNRAPVYIDSVHISVEPKTIDVPRGTKT